MSSASGSRSPVARWREQCGGGGDVPAAATDTDMTPAWCAIGERGADKRDPAWLAVGHHGLLLLWLNPKNSDESNLFKNYSNGFEFIQ
jgi:hypothetical protein